MKIKTLSQEEMLYLRNHGIDISDASMAWIRDGLKTVPNEKEYIESEESVLPAFTFEDLIYRIPAVIVTQGFEAYKLEIFDMLNTIDKKRYYCIRYGRVIEYSHNIPNGTSIRFISDSYLEAAYKMLKWCIDNEYYPVKPVA